MHSCTCLAPLGDGGDLQVERFLGIVNDRLAWGLLEFKSNRGRRTIAVDGDTLGILRTHPVRQNAEKLALGEGYPMTTWCSPELTVPLSSRNG